MISFAAITPHPPLLIPNIGKENIEKLRNTKEAMEDLEKKFSASDIDILIVISSHEKMHHNTFSIIMAEKYVTDLEEFGDFETKLEFLPDMELIEKIRHSALDENVSFTLTHHEKLDYGSAVPLYYLCKDKKPKIVPLIHTYSSPKDHYEMGRIIKKIISESSKKIGVVASGNLSHKSSERGPKGMSPAGKEFNDKFIELIETKNTSGLLGIDKKLADTADQSILLPAAVLMGVVEKLNYKPQMFSYEAPLGVGYLVCNFKLL